MKQETPPTSTEYVEPLGFKGTKGEWDCGYGDFSKSYGIFTKKMLDEGLLESPICLVSPMDKLDDNDKANAKLISQSKELAKSLQDIVNDWIGEGSFKSEPEYKTHNDKTVKDFGYWSPAGKQVKAELIAKAQSILKQAGLTE